MRVVIADDHRLVLDGIKRALEEDGGFEIVGETQSGTQVLPLVGKTSPDLVLLDVRMPHMDGLACLDQIRSRHPDVKVVMLSASSNQELVESALRRGASAYVIKTVNPDDLPATLRQALEGNVHTAVGGEEGGAREREGPRSHGARAHDPRRARPRPLERRDREGVLGRAADREVPPDEHLPQARREEPHGGDAHRVPARARGEPDLRRRITHDVDGQPCRHWPLRPCPGTRPRTRPHARPKRLVRRIAEEEYILIVLLAGFGLIFLLIFPPALVVNDSWLNLMAGREVVENGLPSRDEITVYGLGATWTDQQWLAQVFMYGIYSLGGFALLSLATATSSSAPSRSPLPRRDRSGPAHARSGSSSSRSSSRRRSDWTIRAQMLALPLYTGPPLAARVGGAVADETSLARVPAARRLGERPRKRRARSAARDAPRRVYELVRSRGGTWQRSIALVVLAPLALLATPYGPVETARYYHLLLVDPPFAGRVTEWSWPAPSWKPTSSSSTSSWR